MVGRSCRVIVLFVLPFLLPATTAPAEVVFFNDFESGLPDAFAAPGAVVEPVQGFDGIGHEGREFGGSFLRYSDVSVQDTTLTLTDLPEHDRLRVDFLLALIDSWDGTELFEVRVDGQVLFSHSFQLAVGDSSSYDAPSGALLSSGTNLGFSGGSYYDRDRAYDLSFEPALRYVVHSSDTATITWSLGATSGSAAQNWQGGSDESWAIDNVRVSTLTVTGRCSLPVTEGPEPKVSDCLHVLKTAVGSAACEPDCICAPKGSFPTTAPDALLCLRRAVGQPVVLTCPCG